MKHITRPGAAHTNRLIPTNLRGSVVECEQLAGGAGHNVVPFARRANPAARLSIMDRMDVTSWIEPAFAHGYDRLVVHERAAGDPPDVDSFLSIYRRGEAWARWGVARCGASVLVWCALTGTDYGRFASVSEALGAVLADAAPLRRTADVVSAFA